MTQQEPRLHSPGPVRDDHYKIDEILDSRRRRGVLQYLVRWTSYLIADASWLPHTDISASRLRQQFHMKYPMKAGGRDEIRCVQNTNHNLSLAKGKLVEGAACWASTNSPTRRLVSCRFQYAGLNKERSFTPAVPIST
ncbi:Heterochromatin protein 1, partial [Ophiophagus hannah]